MVSQIQYNISNASIHYFELGISEFHKTRKHTNLNFQAVLGNLCIAVELMLKTVIAKKCFKFLFTNLPLELELKLAYGKDLKISLEMFELKDLEHFKYKTIEIDKSISIFYVLYPEVKQEFKAYFNLFSAVRNIAVHGALPTFQFYDLERVAYLALKLYQLLTSEKNEIYLIKPYTLSNLDIKFLESYNSERIERVKKAIESAKNNSKQIDYWSSFDLNDWDYFVTECPVCNCDGTLTGTTELEFSGTEDSPEYYLTFSADSFKCDECGLELLDYQELKLANMEVLYDRDKDLNRYFEHY